VRLDILVTILFYMLLFNFVCYYYNLIVEKYLKVIIIIMTYVKFTYLNSLFNYFAEMKVEVIKDIIKERLQKKKYRFASISASNARTRKACVSFSIGMQIR